MLVSESRPAATMTPETTIAFHTLANTDSGSRPRKYQPRCAGATRNAFSAKQGTNNSARHQVATYAPVCGSTSRRPYMLTPQPLIRNSGGGDLTGVINGNL